MYEGGGIPIMEAFACGCFIIASEIDLSVRALSMGKLHHAMMGTAAVAIGTAAAPPASPPASAATAKPSFSGASAWKYMPDTMLSPSATMPPAKTQPAIVLLRSSIGYQP